MTGRLPDKTRTWNFINHFRQAGLSSKGGPKGADWKTLPEVFKEQHYTVLGAGKLYHPNKPPNNDEPKSWSQDSPYIKLTTTGCKKWLTGERFCPEDAETPDNKFSDVNTTTAFLDVLENHGAKFKETGKPFFLALGLHFPHQPWLTPKWAVDLYTNRTISNAANRFGPKNAPDVAFTKELDGLDLLSLNMSNPILHDLAGGDAPEGGGGVSFPCPSPTNNTVPLWFERLLRVGYYSAVTHSDWLFGKVLDKLDALGVSEDTLVIVTGDHGWQLGDHAEWGKHTLWEDSARVPLLVRAPWLGNGHAGEHTSSFVELVDLYRTIASLAGISSSSIEEDVDGDDFSQVLVEPDVVLKEVAFSQYSRCPGDRFWPKEMKDQPDYVYNNCESVPAGNMSYMGYSMRTEKWRYTEWFKWDGQTCEADFAAPSRGIELYDEAEAAPFDSENENVAEQYPGVVSAMRAALLKRFDARRGLGCPSDLDNDGSPLEARLEARDIGLQ